MKRTTVVISLMLATAGVFAQPKFVGERTSVDLTIYNANLSLVREERTFTLARGNSSIVVPDIPSTIDATSVHFVSATDPAAVRVLEQNYQYDLVSQAKLMEKYLGKQIEFVRLDESVFQAELLRHFLCGKDVFPGKNIRHCGYR